MVNREVGESSAAVWSAAMALLSGTGDGGEVAMMVVLYGKRCTMKREVK
jgi:hypothetical protein